MQLTGYLNSLTEGFVYVGVYWLVNFTCNFVNFTYKNKLIIILLITISQRLIISDGAIVNISYYQKRL